MEIESTRNDIVITNDDIYELITQGKDILIMKTSVEVISGDAFRINNSYSKKLKDIINDYMDSIVNISEELYRCSSKEIWKKVRATGNVNYAMISVVVAKNDSGNYIKLSVPCLKMHKESLNSYKGTEEEISKILRLKDIIDKLEEITIDLTEVLHRFISEKISQLIKASKENHFEILTRFDGEKLNYESFVANGSVDYAMEEFYMLNLIRNENVLKKIECELDEELSFLPKKSLIKIVFNYDGGEVKGLSYYPVLKAL